MTREERDKAIDIFEHNWTRIVNADYTEEELNTAFSKALEALKAQPCGDCISREHLLHEIAELMKSPWFNHGKDDCTITRYGYVERKEAVEIVRDLCVKEEPPVIPKQRTGKIIKGMTKKEASFILMLAKNRVCDNELNEALDMAIKALNQEPILEKIKAESEGAKE